MSLKSKKNMYKPKEANVVKLEKYLKNNEKADFSIYTSVSKKSRS